MKKKQIKKCVAIVSAVAVVISGAQLSGMAQAAAKPKLNKKKATIAVGGSVRLKLKRAKKKVTWKSSNKKVAAVSRKGLVKGKKTGKANIVAKSGGKKYVCRVTVTKKGSASSDSNPSNNTPSGTQKPKATQTAAPKKTTTPSSSPSPGTSQVSSGGLPSGNHALVDASEGLTISADDGVYSFKLGMTAEEITTGFGKPAKTEKMPQGYEVYIYYNTYASYFQVYIDNGIVVGAATMSPGFTYEGIVTQGMTHGSLTGFTSLPGKYYYQEAYYKKTSTEYISIYLDRYGTVGSGGVYAVQVFSATNGQGKSVSMDDLYMGNTISDNGGYTEEVLTNMASQIYDWCCAFRVSKGLAPFQKFTVSGIGDSVAQSVSDYNAGKKDSSTTDSSNRTWQDRFNQEYANPAGWDDYYVGYEMVGDASPDALGYVTWFLNASSSSTGETSEGQNYNNLLKTKNTKDDVAIGDYYLCAGVSYNQSAKATYAVVDMFALD